MRPQALALIAAAAGGAGATAAVAVAGASPARPASAVVGTARVQGRFAAAGEITAVEHVSGVRRGEHFSHTWSISGEGCRASSCTKLSLEARLGAGAGAVDRMILSRVSPGRYRWRHTVSSAARCRTRHITGIYRDVSALDVTVTRRVEVNGVWYATALRATGSASSGGCATTTIRVAATYAATVTSGVPAAALPTGSTTTSSPTTGSVASTTTTDPTTTFPSSTGTTPTVTTISSTPSPTIPTTTTPHAPQPEPVSS